MFFEFFGSRVCSLDKSFLCARLVSKRRRCEGLQNTMSGIIHAAPLIC